MNLLMIASIFGFLGLGPGESLDSQSPRVLRTSTPCIATQTFLDELRKMLLESEGRKQNDTGCSGGAVYTRWGRKDCPSGRHLVYTGLAGGGYYTHTGASATTMCLPQKPEYDRQNMATKSATYSAFIYGTEYQTIGDSRLQHLHDQDVPCAVCKTRVTRNILMIPAKTSCPQGWHLEYKGYLMGGYYKQAASSDYLCVDGMAQPLNGGHENRNGHLLYLVKGQCGVLPCPPYKHDWEFACVVCSL